LDLPNWCEEIVVLVSPPVEIEIARHHTDDRPGATVVSNTAADDRRVRSKTTAPKGVTDHHHRLGAGPIVGFREKPAQLWRHAQGREETGAHGAPEHAQRFTVLNQNASGRDA